MSDSSLVQRLRARRASAAHALTSGKRWTRGSINHRSLDPNPGRREKSRLTHNNQTWNDGHVNRSITIAPTPAAPPAQALARTAGAELLFAAKAWQSHYRWKDFSEGQAPTFTAKRLAGILTASHSTCVEALKQTTSA